MKPSPEKLLSEHFNKLPNQVQDIFNSEIINNHLEEVAIKYKLSEGDQDILFESIGYVLFKVIAVSQFQSELKKSLGGNSALALNISSEIYGTVFLPIKKYLAETPEDIPAVWKNYKEESVPNNNQTSATTSTSSEDSSLNEALNPNDIIKEIESPTPSIQNPVKVDGPVKNIAFNSNSTELDLDTIELPSKTLQVPETKVAVAPKASNALGTPKIQSAQNSTQTNPSNSQDIQLHGFAPIDNSVHPAQKIADKLQGTLTQPTKTEVKEVYQVKSPDPYREPFI